MAQYYITRPTAIPVEKATGTRTWDANEEALVLLEYDKHCETLLSADVDLGWAAELRLYTDTMQREVTKNTDLVEWWQVRNNFIMVIDTHRHSVEQCNIIPHTCTYCPRRPAFSSLICSLRASIFGQQTNRDGSMGALRASGFWRICNHGVCMETWPLRYGCLE